MGFSITCCVVVFTLFSFNLNQLVDQVFEPPVSFLKSLFSTNNLPKSTKDTKSYTLALVGDSMTQYLGTADELRNALKTYYPNKEFGILNFGIGSTSILSVPERLKEESQRVNETLPPILDTKPDIIFLESFGNNPLSQFSLEEGLKKQTETLDQTIKIIKENNPNTVLVFIATIAPSKERYAEGVVNLSTDQRVRWAEERIAYIKNHIEYSKLHNIPLVNIYEKSLNNQGDGNIDYINTHDFIHPSPSGIKFISQQIAENVFSNKIIPQEGVK